MEGKTARGASSPANPALHMPDIRKKNIIYFKNRITGIVAIHRRRMFRSTVPATSPLYFFFTVGYNSSRVLKEDDASLLSLKLAPSPFPWLATSSLLPSLLVFILSVWQVEDSCKFFYSNRER
jgi:hypothetical protein